MKQVSWYIILIIFELCNPITKLEKKMEKKVITKIVYMFFQLLLHQFMNVLILNEGQANVNIPVYWFI